MCSVQVNRVLYTGELYVGCVLSTQAHARLVKVDPAPALAMAGVVDFVSHLDVPGSNVWGAGEEVFASTEVGAQWNAGHIRFTNSNKQRQ